jgi:hypothetical protein
VSAEHHGGNAIPSIEREEHRSFGGVNAKAVFTYDLPVAERIDDTTTADVLYVGLAAIGTATSAATWQVQKISTASGVVVTWADGNSSYDNIWDNRASLTYS